MVCHSLLCQEIIHKAKLASQYGDYTFFTKFSFFAVWKASLFNKFGNLRRLEYKNLKSL